MESPFQKKYLLKEENLKVPLLFKNSFNSSRFFKYYYLNHEKVRLMLRNFKKLRKYKTLALTEVIKELAFIRISAASFGD